MDIRLQRNAPAEPFYERDETRIDLHEPGGTRPLSALKMVAENRHAVILGDPVRASPHFSATGRFVWRSTALNQKWDGAKGFPVGPGERAPSPCVGTSPLFTLRYVRANGGGFDGVLPKLDRIQELSQKLHQLWRLKAEGSDWTDRTCCPVFLLPLALTGDRSLVWVLEWHRQLPEWLILIGNICRPLFPGPGMVRFFSFLSS